MDLARIAPMSRDEKRRALRQMKTGYPPHSYDPFRREILDILHVTPGPLAAGPRTPWSIIAAEIFKRSKTTQELDANLGVGKALYDFSNERRVSGRGQEFYPLALGTTQKLTYWSSAVIAVDGTAMVPFLDPRRSKKLSVDARQFVFSAMHERIRAADPDYADVRLAIIQFGTGSDGVRVPRLFTDEGVTLFDFEALDRMVRETYELWQEVLEEREVEARRKGTGTRGPLV